MGVVLFTLCFVGFWFACRFASLGVDLICWFGCYFDTVCVGLFCLMLVQLIVILLSDVVLCLWRTFVVLLTCLFGGLLLLVSLLIDLCLGC